MAAIATNIEVRGGSNDYYVCRTLGIEFGGTIGIVLFLGQSVSIAFYAMGFGEAATALVGTDGDAAPQIVAAVAVIVFFGFAWLGADVASRLQSVMVLPTAALVSFSLGAFDSLTSGLASAAASTSSRAEFHGIDPRPIHPVSRSRPW